MLESDLIYSGIAELSSLIRKREISAAELVKIYLERIERLQPKLNAYITICGEEALASATTIDNTALKNDQYEKPLLGVPIALKDQIATRGILTTNGSLVLSDYVPHEDATVVARLKEAGAIILGKLNMSEFALAGDEDPPFGQPRNPWNTDYSPGGSSSGSGVAVSAGLCASSIGEDSGGSGRIPANYCGVVGLRPSSGLVSRHGINPVSPSFDTAGPMGRTVEDCAFLLQVIAGHDPKDALSSRRPVPDYLAGLKDGVKGVRIGVIQDFMDDENLNPEVRSAVARAITVLSELGASMSEISVPYIKSSMYALGIMIWCEGSALNRRRFESKQHLFRQSTRIGLMAGCLLPAEVYLRARQAQALIRAKILETFQNMDLLICPVSPKTAPKIKSAQKAASFPAPDYVVKRHEDGHVGFAALAGCPAISVPCGFSQSGLPIGVQIVGRPFEDATILRVAHSYEQQTNWHKHHPEL
jgi:aspartyl-tRNA(Asn)/glutamyl-tRNA(Gln) amidotransferase subunit A